MSAPATDRAHSVDTARPAQDGQWPKCPHPPPAPHECTEETSTHARGRVDRCRCRRPVVVVMFGCMICVPKRSSRASCFSVNKKHLSAVSVATAIKEEKIHLPSSDQRRRAPCTKFLAASLQSRFLRQYVPHRCPCAPLVDANELTKKMSWRVEISEVSEGVLVDLLPGI